MVQAGALARPEPFPRCPRVASRSDVITFLKFRYSAASVQALIPGSSRRRVQLRGIPGRRSVQFLKLLFRHALCRCECAVARTCSGTPWPSNPFILASPGSGRRKPQGTY